METATTAGGMLQLAQVFNLGNAIIDFFTETNWSHVVFGIKIFSFLLSAAMVAAIVYTLKKHRDMLLGATPHVKGQAYTTAQLTVDAEEKRFEHEEWGRIEKLWGSRSENERRLALIDADALLDSALRETSIPGDTMADRLSSPEMPALSHLNEVAFAHKFRNELVHEGGGTTLDPIDAERAFKAYKQALEEMGVI